MSTDGVRDVHKNGVRATRQVAKNFLMHYVEDDHIAYLYYLLTVLKQCT